MKKYSILYMTIFLLIFQINFFSKGVNAIETITFIVNSANPINELSTNDILDYYMKRKRLWPNGTTVRFIDHVEEAPERIIFLKLVIGQSGRDLDLYWIGQKLANGNSAPLQAASDNIVSAIVSRFPGAISYVASSSPIPPGVKKIQLKGR